MSTQTASSPDFAAIKTKQQATWASGNYAVVGSTLQIVPELLCEAMDLHSGSQVLDVCAGNGASTLAAARRWCQVTSTDWVPALLARGKARADAEGFTIAFQEADAENLPFADNTFDAVLSTFGVMFTPNQQQSSAELFRVCKPGGKIGLACWTPTGFVGQMFKVISKHVPPPAGLNSPLLWGTEERLRELFPSAAKIQAKKTSCTFRYLSPQHYVDIFRTYYGPMVRTFAALDEAGQAALSSDLVTMMNSVNQATDGTLITPSEYLEIVITK
jgi:ubiquinone/menaquinone biosynthesis C-methylase UbiE